MLDSESARISATFLNDQQLVGTESLSLFTVSCLPNVLFHIFGDVKTYFYVLCDSMFIVCTHLPSTYLPKSNVIFFFFMLTSCISWSKNHRISSSYNKKICATKYSGLPATKHTPFVSVLKLLINMFSVRNY